MTAGITDQVAKDSSDSTASDHPIHDQSDQAAKAHKGAPVRSSSSVALLYTHPWAYLHMQLFAIALENEANEWLYRDPSAFRTSESPRARRTWRSALRSWTNRWVTPSATIRIWIWVWTPGGPIAWPRLCYFMYTRCRYEIKHTWELPYKISMPSYSTTCLYVTYV